MVLGKARHFQAKKVVEVGRWVGGMSPTTVTDWTKTLSLRSDLVNWTSGNPFDKPEKIAA